jgi:hypothetical protein
MKKNCFSETHHINTMQAQVIGFCLMVIKRDYHEKFKVWIIDIE